MLSFPRRIVVDNVVVRLVIIVSHDASTPSNAEDHLLLLGSDDARNLGFRESFQLLKVLTILKIPYFDGPVTSA